MPLISGLYFLIAGATKANVVVTVRRRVVQIQVERPSIAGVVPIAATDETAL
jgi:Ni,Fe-hydrogenase III component G